MAGVEIQTQSVEMKTCMKCGGETGQKAYAGRIRKHWNFNVLRGNKKIVCKISKDGTPLAII